MGPMINVVSVMRLTPAIVDSAKMCPVSGLSVKLHLTNKRTQRHVCCVPLSVVFVRWCSRQETLLFDIIDISKCRN